MADSVKIALPDIQRGDTEPYTINFSDDLGAIPMQGKTLVMTLKLTTFDEDEDAFLTKTVDIPDNVDTQAGIVEFKLEPSETSMLQQGQTYQYAIRIITTAVPEDDERTYFYGPIKVKDA